MRQPASRERACRKDVYTQRHANLAAHPALTHGGAEPIRRRRPRRAYGPCEEGVLPSLARPLVACAIARRPGRAVKANRRPPPPPSSPGSRLVSRAWALTPGPRGRAQPKRRRCKMRERREAKARARFGSAARHRGVRHLAFLCRPPFIISLSLSLCFFAHNLLYLILALVPAPLYPPRITLWMSAAPLVRAQPDLRVCIITSSFNFHLRGVPP